MSNYYQAGLALPAEIALPRRVREGIDGARDFHVGSRRFYDREMVVGAASRTPFGDLADGIVAIVIDAIHVLVMIGGAIFIFRAIFP